MTIARAIINQAGSSYRFLNFEARPDGSLLIFLDRSVPSAKISCHTTGEIHYYHQGNRRDTFHVEPLYQISGPQTIAFFSIPSPDRLDQFDNNKHMADALAILDVPAEITERMTFAVDLAPSAPAELQTLGIAVNYELYSAVVRLISRSPVPITSEIVDHFVCGVARPTATTSRLVDPANAELAFHRAIHGNGAIVFRASAGYYVALAGQPKRIAPQIEVEFDRRDLRAEPVRSDSVGATHKVAFWICDRGGRNKTDDLRAHITSIAFSADL